MNVTPTQSRRNEVAKRRERVAALWKEGKTALEIALEIGSPIGTVGNDVVHLRSIGADLHPRRRRLDRDCIQAMWNHGFQRCRYCACPRHNERLHR